MLKPSNYLLPLTLFLTRFSSCLKKQDALSLLIVGIENHWVAFQLHTVALYYGVMKSHIVARSGRQTFLQLCDKGGYEVAPKARLSELSVQQRKNITTSLVK